MKDQEKTEEYRTWTLVDSKKYYNEYNENWIVETTRQSSSIKKAIEDTERIYNKHNYEPETLHLIEHKALTDLQNKYKDLEAKLEKAEEQMLKTGFECSVCGEGYTRAISLDKIEVLEAKLEKAVEALEYYANPEINDRRKFLVLSDLARDDLYESDWTRFAFGRKAKETLEEIKGE